ncbi:MAG TPA: NAD(P)/FAD-dependent oxidoreductase [Stellaceae bacterium]|nr:NAD(P)/FAD-dependent oxidoreductase [Stellaceae bacterium]
MSDALVDAEIVVIGAGAAGLAAAHHLRAEGRSVLILEARDRIGGRAHTLMTAPGFPVDLGCGWLHSADLNPWVGIARTLGFTIDETPPGWGERLVRAGFSMADQENWLRTRDDFYERLEEAADGPDRPAITLLEPGNRWNTLLNMISTRANGVELDRLSAHDYQRYEDTELNWRVTEGYGALVARFGADLPVRLDAPVSAIDWSGGRVALETPRGTVRARAAILAMPPTVIAAGAIAFTPALPVRKQEAAHGLPLGIDNKFYFHLAGDWPEIGKNWHISGAIDRMGTGSYQLKPHGRPVIEMYLGGDHALELERAGFTATAAFGRDELARLYGSRIRSCLTPLAGSAWTTDPYARGSYSYAKPGHADDRAIWAAPLAERLFFAGEATSPNFFSTTHGAYLSGLRAAKEAIAALESR